VTIRRYLVWRLITAWLVLMAGFGLIILAASHMQHLQPKPPVSWLIAALIVSWGLFFLMQSRIKCPRCGHIYWLLNLWDFTSLTDCPRCGVSLEEPAEAPGPIY
jgi:hypothetical protein